MNWRTIGEVSYELWKRVITEAGGPSDLASRSAYDAAKPHSALVLAMAGIECQWGTTENLNKLTNRNVLNLKMPLQSNGTRKDGFMSFPTWAAGVKAAVDRITSTTYGNGIYAGTESVLDLVEVFAPRSENDTNEYVNFVETHISVWETVPADQPGEESPVSTPNLVIVVDAGHRSTDRSGNPAEMQLTGFMAADVVAELRTRGHEAYWYQRDVDKDSDPDETVGDLNTVSLGIAQWGATQIAQGKEVLFLSEHYNGANSAIHVIVPDVTGLTTAYGGGAPADDAAANNVLDVKLAAQIAQNYKESGLGTLYQGQRGLPAGIMSERDTGVAIQYQARLAVFAATARNRAKMTRVVVENGGTSDAAAQRDDFTVRCAKAQADAIDAVYGKAVEQPAPAPAPTPVSTKRTKITGEIRDRIHNGRLYLAVNPRRIKLVSDAVQFADPDLTKRSSKTVLPKGRTVTAPYVTTTKKGVLVRATVNGTHFEAGEFVEEAAA